MGELSDDDRRALNAVLDACFTEYPAALGDGSSSLAAMEAVKTKASWLINERARAGDAQAKRIMLHLMTESVTRLIAEDEAMGRPIFSVEDGVRRIKQRYGGRPPA